MGQDFTKGLNVCIGNYGYYNEGSLHDAWITLPKTEAEIRDFLHLNQLQDSQHEEIYISDYDGIPFGTRLRTAISITALTDRTKIIMTVTSWFPLSATVMMRSILRARPKRRTAAWDINRKSAAMPPNCSMTGNRLWRLHPRSINRRKAYGAIPGKSLARINVRGTFSL